MKKRINSIIGLLVLVVVLAGCGSSDAKNADVATTQQVATTSDETKENKDSAEKNENTFSTNGKSENAEVASGTETGGNDITIAEGDKSNEASAVKNGETTSDEITFQDDLGREIKVKANAKAATLMGSFADVWTLAGGELVAATKDAWTYDGLTVSESVVNIGDKTKFDIELLITAKPDVVIGSANLAAHLELEASCEQAGIQIAYFDINNIDDYLRVLKQFTEITGKAENYKTYGTDVKAKVEESIARADGSNPEILYLRASSDKVSVKASDGNVGAEMLRDLGCINIADSDESLLEELSLEVILVKDPKYIFVTTMGEDTEKALNVVEQTLKSNPVWNSLTAVKEGRYYVLDKNLYNTKPNARWGEAYEHLADILFE